MRTKAGYQDDSGLGGPSSVSAHLAEDDRIKEPVFRLPAFKAFFEPWFQWKARINEQYGLELGFDYSMLY